MVRENHKNIKDIKNTENVLDDWIRPGRFSLPFFRHWGGEISLRRGKVRPWGEKVLQGRKKIRKNGGEGGSKPKTQNSSFFSNVRQRIRAKTAVITSAMAWEARMPL